MPAKAFSSRNPVVLIGAGNMGGAMLSGWLKSGVPGSAVIVVDPGPSPAMLATIGEAGARHLTAVPAELKASVLFLAVKPQVMETVLPAVKSAVGAETVVVSVAAGKTLGYLEKHLGKAAMVRAMPNTPAMVAAASLEPLPIQRLAISSASASIPSCASPALWNGCLRRPISMP